MKKLDLKLGATSLSKEEMKKITGGYICDPWVPGYFECQNEAGTYISCTDTGQSCEWIWL